MKFSIKVDSENDACQTREDLAWMVSRVMGAVEQGKTEGNVKDQNGLTVGKWSLELVEEEENEEGEG
jgi:hypothetical protein